MFGDFDIFLVKHACLTSLHHIHSAMNIAIVASYYSYTCASNGYVQENRTIMMDDVFIYHAHTFFALFCACVGYLDLVSTSASHELTIRALESEPHTFDHDSLLQHLSYHFVIVKNAQGHAFKVTSFLSMDIADHSTCVACTMRLLVHIGPLDCSHVRDLASTCHFHHSMHHDIYALCVASNSWITCSPDMFGCNNVITSHMSCPIDCYMLALISSHMMNS
mgnify:CR=1 FL=1